MSGGRLDEEDKDDPLSSTQDQASQRSDSQSAYPDQPSTDSLGVDASNMDSINKGANLAAADGAGAAAGAEEAAMVMVV